MTVLQPGNSDIAGVACSARDLIRFVEHYLQGKYLPGAMIQSEAWAPQYGSFLGLGWYLIHVPIYDNMAIIVRSNSRSAEHDIFAMIRPCGRLGAIVIGRRRNPDTYPYAQYQFVLDLLNILTELHTQAKGIPHELVWEIP